MESAKTMVAQSIGDGPISDGAVDSAPARIRIAPPPARPAIVPREEESPSSDGDSDDSMRTLVRNPEDVAPPQRMGPQNTEVIEVTGVTGLAGAPSPAVAAKPAPPPLMPRTVKATLKSAGEFQPGEAVVPDRPSVPHPPAGAERPDPFAKTTTDAFAATAKQSGPDAIAGTPGVNPIAQTVPAIDAAMVASVIASGAKGTGGAGTVAAAVAAATQAPAAPAPVPVPAAPQVQTARMPAPTPAALAPLMAVPPPPPPALPQTPPIYPMAPPAPDAGALPKISGARGLLIGFLAGALIMALLAVVFLAVMK